MNKAEYHRYLASREWALLKRAVRKRCGNVCERCHKHPMQALHHLTYERIGQELLEDLMAICEPCHQFVSGELDVDPALNKTVPDDKGRRVLRKIWQLFPVIDLDYGTKLKIIFTEAGRSWPPPRGLCLPDLSDKELEKAHQILMVLWTHQFQIEEPQSLPAGYLGECRQ